MNPLTKNYISELIGECEKHHLKSLELFGSAVRDDFNEKSDIDFLYEFEAGKIAELDYADNYFAFLFSLENLLKRKVDLVPAEKVKNPFLLKQINSEKVKIYG